MKLRLKNVPRNGLAIILTLGMVTPSLTPAFAAPNGAGLAGLPELFPIDPKPKSNPTNNGGSSNNKPSGGSVVTSGPSGNGKMRTANVAAEYSCPLFDNKPHAELLAAIDSLSNEVKISQECSNNPSVASLVQNADSLKSTVNSLKEIVNAPDAESVNVQDIDQKVTAAIQATQTLGTIINNNSFLSSACGRQSMKSGKALLAFNDILNGLSPYALMAVSMNAALAPALPYVIGGIVVTSGISAMSKMIDQNTLDMTNADHRTAVLVNTCQFMKVARKVRFMQLAQSGRIDRITAELEKNVQLYNSQFGKPSKELNQLLALKSSVDRTLVENEEQLKEDQSSLSDLQKQLSSSNDDMMMCMLGAEMVALTSDGVSFPASVYTNLEVTARNTNGNKLQVASLKSLNTTSIKKISLLAQKVDSDETAVSACATTVKSWIAGHKQAIQLTSGMIQSQKQSVERQLSENTEYRMWKTQFDRLQLEKLTVTRVEKAMTELAKDNSIIDRSELDQRMSLLKAGLFGRRGSWAFGKSPVQAWLDHTKSMHDRSVSSFLSGVEVLNNTAYNLSYNQKMEEFRQRLMKAKVPMVDYGTLSAIQAEALRASKNMATLTLNNLPLGSRENELVCGQLETAWLDWSAAMDHLGATQFFCDMIDPVLDVKVDKAIVSYCRGSENVTATQRTAVSQAKDLLVRKGYQASASIVSKKMKELNCPLPPVSVMNGQ